MPATPRKVEALRKSQLEEKAAGSVSRKIRPRKGIHLVIRFVCPYLARKLAGSVSRKKKQRKDMSFVICCVCPYLDVRKGSQV